MARILVIDDEVQIRELLRKALGQAGYEVVTVPTAAQALDKVSSEPVDLVLLDLYLADEPGISVLKKIRAMNAKIPVIIFTGRMTAEVENEVRQAGATEILIKNVGISKLVLNIQKYVPAADIHPKKGAKILVVDDEPAIRMLLKMFLNSKGYEVIEAENGEEAVRIVSSEPVSLVLLDMVMPRMDGLTALGKILKIRPKLGVLIAAAVQADDKVKQALASGACGYVLKPFDFLYLELAVVSRLAAAESS